MTEKRPVGGVEYVQEFVEFLFAGVMFSESETRRISGFDRMMNKPGEIPKGCFGYRYFSRVVVEMDDGREFLDKAYDYSPMYYFGITYTLEEVKKFEPANEFKILVSNMENNGWDRVVRTTQGNYQPLEEGDVVYDSPTG